MENGHLNFYLKHNISPVFYNNKNINSHIEMRESLYFLLGLNKNLIKNSSILEVAPGSGQNSIFCSLCLPKKFELLEPNPSAIEQINKQYTSLNIAHTKPVITQLTLQEYKPSYSFDLVICENWIGSLKSELSLLNKLGNLVSSDGGIICLTFSPLAGLIPNFLRKLLSFRIINKNLNFNENTNQLVYIFEPHLSTLENMTRSHSDWVHDCILNPQFFYTAITISDITESLGLDFEIFNTFPKFTVDWRWFKSLNRQNRNFNKVVLDSFNSNLHNLINFKLNLAPLKPLDNDIIAKTVNHIHSIALNWQINLESSNNELFNTLKISLAENVILLRDKYRFIDEYTFLALDEFLSIWNDDYLDGDDIRNMKYFNSLFGKETFYITLLKK